MRANHIDIARAMAITLVVLGHGPIGLFHPDLQQALGNVRMPFLLMLAGMHFRPGTPLWQTARSKADALLKPYLVMAVLLGAHAWWTGRTTDMLRYTTDVLSFNGLQMPGWLFPLWFITLLWALHVSANAWWRLTTMDRWSTPMRWGFTAALGTVGFLCLPSAGLDVYRCVNSGLGYLGLPFNLDLLPLAGMWFLAGQWLSSDWQAPEGEWHDAWVWSLLSAAIFLIWHPKLDMLERDAQAPVASVAMAMSGAMALLAWSRLVNASAMVSRWVRPLGKHSLYILLFHAPIQSLMIKLVPSALPGPVEPYAWACAAIVLMVCVELGKLAQRLPWLMAGFEPMARVRNLQVHRAAALPRAPVVRPPHAV